MYLTGIAIGLFSFVVIGVFHPIVIQCEYHFTYKVWPVFLLFGLVGLFFSLVIPQPLPSAICSVFGFTCLWSIGELKEQRERVKKGWFPQNPKRAGQQMADGNQEGREQV